MTFKSFALASVATLALCASADIASAQNDPTQYSTPAEQQQTQQLNSQATNGTTTATPEQLNGRPEAADSEGPPPPNAEQQEYERQLRINRAQQSQYEEESAQYHAQYGDAPVSDSGPPPAPPPGYEPTAYPPAPPYSYSDNLWTLGRIADPTHQLAQLPIEGPDGRWIGKVRNVDVDSGGFARRLEVAVDPQHSVWVAPSHFRYDADNKLLFSDLSYDQLWQHPGATYESGEP